MPPPTRLRALDVFRGLTVAGMILVNSPGRDDVYRLLEHAPWNGLTLADLVFPFFLVCVGISAALSHAAQRARGRTNAAIVRHAAWRAAGLFALGVLVNVVIFREATGIRWPGVLQRIALCSLGVSAFLLLERPALEPFVAASMLIGYWLLLTRVPVPGFGAGVLTPEGNLASWLDRRWMGGHLMTPLVDPEGLLSTLPAFATTLIGLIVGRRLLDGKASPERLGATGLVLIAAGAIWSRFLPLNKHLWTSSYALLCAGLCLSAFSLCLRWANDRAPARHSIFAALGRHALAAYVLSGLIYGVQEFARVTLPDGRPGNLKLWLTARLFDPWLAPRAAALAYALAYTALSAILSSAVARGVDDYS